VNQQRMKEFPPFWLDTVNQCLWRNAERITLTPRAFLVLRYLVERAGQLVTHDELLDALWPNAFVQPEVLKSHILEIRTALGDSAKSPSFIETLPRRGYRFIAPVLTPKQDRSDTTGPREELLNSLRRIRADVDAAIDSLREQQPETRDADSILRKRRLPIQENGKRRLETANGHGDQQTFPIDRDIP
jgi:DNA-binding winged helix-turn-helix (wHTH) protein